MDKLRHDPSLDALLERWKIVEEDLKKAELLGGQVVIPAINELRYAGRHVIRAINDSRDFDSDKFIDAVKVANHFLTNAEHDIVDSVVAFFSSRIQELNQRYGRAAIIRRNPNYARIDALIGQCKQQIARARKESNERFELYRSLQQSQIPELVSLYDEFVLSDIAMSVELQQLRSENAKNVARAKITITTLSVALVLVIILNVELLFR